MRSQLDAEDSVAGQAIRQAGARLEAEVGAPADLDDASSREPTEFYQLDAHLW